MKCFQKYKVTMTKKRGPGLAAKTIKGANKIFNYMDLSGKHLMS